MPALPMFHAGILSSSAMLRSTSSYCPTMTLEYRSRGHEEVARSWRYYCRWMHCPIFSDTEVWAQISWKRVRVISMVAKQTRLQESSSERHPGRKRKSVGVNAWCWFGV